MGQDLWQVQIPLIEKVLRTVAVYGGLVVLLRLGGKREWPSSTASTSS